MRWAAFGLLGVLMLAPDRSAAQPQPAASPGEAQLAGPLLSPQQVPVSLERIKRRLAERPGERTGLLQLAFYVEVHGKAPPLDLFAGFDLAHGPVPFAPPTHRDILEVVTPQEFRSPPADLLTPLQALFEWLRRQGSRPDSRPE